MKRGMDEKEKGGREGREKRRRWINQEIRQKWKKERNKGTKERRKENQKVSK